MQLQRLQDVPCWVVRALFLLALALGLVFLLVPLHARAEPIYRAEKDGIVVTVFSEACAVPEVTNLPRRALWLEGGGALRRLRWCDAVRPSALLLQRRPHGYGHPRGRLRAS